MRDPKSKPSVYCSRTADKFVVRLPDGMRERIMDVARAHHRSMNSEIIARLETSLDEDEQGVVAEETLLVERKEEPLQLPPRLVNWQPCQGESVEHPTFGPGVIRHITVESGSLMVGVQFGGGLRTVPMWPETDLKPLIIKVEV